MQIPVLAVNGTKDVQIEVENLPVIGASLTEGGNEDFLLVQLSGLNYLFQTASTGATSEYAQIEENFAPAALDVIGEWIAAHTTHPTAVVEIFTEGIPDDFGLAQNYPNPFNRQTLIPLSLDQPWAVTLTLVQRFGPESFGVGEGPARRRKLHGSLGWTRRSWHMHWDPGCTSTAWKPQRKSERDS